MPDILDKMLTEKAELLLEEAIFGQMFNKGTEYKHFVQPEELSVLLLAGARPDTGGINIKQRDGAYVHNVSYKGIRFVSATTEALPEVEKSDLVALIAESN